MTEAITLATTTSTRDSGLLDELIPEFEQQSGITVKVIAVGSGQALEMGRRGDADVLLTHAPAAEEQFMADGHGSQRRPVMHNDFVLVGPESDPAKIRGETSVSKAFSEIARKKVPFVSRGDKSGTYMKEKGIWSKTELEPTGEWYLEAGAGMAQTLRLANEKQAYTLCDRGTYLAQKSGLELKVLSEGDSLLLNHYSVMLVNPEKHPSVHFEAAEKFADYLISAETQQAISEFGIQKFGSPLFYSHAADMNK